MCVRCGVVCVCVSSCVFQLCRLLLLVTQIVAHFGEVEILAGAAAVNVQHVQTGRLKVSGGVVRLGDEQLRLTPVLLGTKLVAHSQEPIPTNPKLKRALCLFLVAT
jgi:hypothetical protein